MRTGRGVLAPLGSATTASGNPATVRLVKSGWSGMGGRALGASALASSGACASSRAMAASMPGDASAGARLQARCGETVSPSAIASARAPVAVFASRARWALRVRGSALVVTASERTRGVSPGRGSACALVSHADTTLSADAPADGQVEVCTFTGMGHCWAGGSTTGSGASFGCPTYASATQLEWSFFKKYAW